MDKHGQVNRPPLFVRILVPCVCGLVAFGAFVSGTLVSVRCHRVAPRVTEKGSRTSGNITVPVQVVTQEGRVDVTVRRLILGVVPWRTVTLEDVTNADSSSSTTTIRRSRNAAGSSYGTGTLTLRTRGGRSWRSDEASGVLGSPPAEVAEGVAAFIDGDGTGEKRFWWVPWFNNLIGLPFALVSMLTGSGCVAHLAGRRATTDA
jgi:hypothetical protein